MLLHGESIQEVAVVTGEAPQLVADNLAPWHNQLNN